MPGPAKNISLDMNLMSAVGKQIQDFLDLAAGRSGYAPGNFADFKQNARLGQFGESLSEIGDGGKSFAGAVTDDLNGLSLLGDQLTAQLTAILQVTQNHSSAVNDGNEQVKASFRPPATDK